ncbi:hypothetical protein NEOKW01_0815 [Nematocida sp. AWRm80]|nr:hypothetical protein NEOKW01_0815 [Nematocida sp. AWRm80]
MTVGRQIIQELSTGNTMYDLLSRNTEELEKIEEQLKKGELPDLFRLHSKDSLFTPSTPEDFCKTLDLIDLSKAKYSLLKEITTRVVGYPIAYYEVKKRIASVLFKAGRENIKKTKRLDVVLFKAFLEITGRSTKAFTEGILIPWVESEMTTAESLVLSRVIMKALPDREYSEELILTMITLPRTHPLFTLLTALLIKRIKFSQETINQVHEYILDIATESQRYLAHNKVVLSFIRGYHQSIDLNPLLNIYHTPSTSIEIQIENELKLYSHKQPV